MNASIVVVGSANVDLIVRVPRSPAPGETLLATSSERQPGGKGANQAVAAARLGGRVSFVAAVGDDADGRDLRAALDAEGIDTADVETLAAVPTGLAVVSVTDAGENSITVVPGANAALDPARATARIAREGRGSVVVLQCEVPAEVVEAAIEATAAAGGRAVVNLAPYRPLGDGLVAHCDPLVLNEGEASAYVGAEVGDLASVEKAAIRILTLAKSVVITLGARGAFWADSTGSGRLEAPPVSAVVDSTGAGDAFVGALAASLAEGMSLADAAARGVAAGSFAVGSLGAQSSYPRSADLD